MPWRSVTCCLIPITSLLYHPLLIHIDLIDQPIDVNAALQTVEDDGAGAINTFIGTVRNKSTGRPVVRLEYEAYDSMALHQLRKVAEQAQEQWPMLRKVTVIHRKGTLNIGDVAVIVAVSTPHRAESFAACQYIIDTLKQVVTIWKKEFYEDGDVWVAAHP